MSEKKAHGFAGDHIRESTEMVREGSANMSKDGAMSEKKCGASVFGETRISRCIREIGHEGEHWSVHNKPSSSPTIPEPTEIVSHGVTFLNPPISVAESERAKELKSSKESAVESPEEGCKFCHMKIEHCICQKPEEFEESPEPVELPSEESACIHPTGCPACASGNHCATCQHSYWSNHVMTSPVKSPEPSKWDEYMKQHGREEYGMESPEQRLERELGFKIEYRGTTPIIYHVNSGWCPVSCDMGKLWRKCLTLMEQVEQLTHELVCSQDQYRDCHRDWIEMKTRAEAAEANLREQAEAVGETNRLLETYESILTEMRTTAIAGNRIQEWVSRIDFARDEFAARLKESPDKYLLRTALERIERGKQS